MALFAGSVESVALHLRSGGSVHAVDDKGRTPLILAAMRGHVDLCDFLLREGAECYSRDREGKDALAVASAQGHSKVIELIRESGRNPTVAAAAQNENALALKEEEQWPASEAQAAQPLPAEPANQVSSDQTPAQLAARESIVFDPVSPEWQPLGSDEALEPLDLSQWEEELEAARPFADPTCADEATALQRLISRHVVVDSADGWAEVEIDLPDPADVQPRGYFLPAEQREAIRLLFVEALRDGRIRKERVAAIETGADEEDGERRDFGALFELVLEDLGVAIDDADDIPDQISEPDDVDEDLYGDAAFEALGFLCRLLSGQDALYFRFLNSAPKAVVGREEMIALGEERDAGLLDACRTLAGHPATIEKLRGDIQAVLAGSFLVRAMIEQDFSARNEEPAAHRADEDVDFDDEETRLDNAVSDTKPTDAEAIQILGAACEAAGRAPEHLARCLMAVGLRATYFESLCASAEGSPDAHARLQAALERARRARMGMVGSNLRLAIWVAKKHRGLPMMDRIQEGSLGLMKAAEKFSPSRGTKFSTYAVWWIRQAITRARADQARLIRLPVHVQDGRAKINRAKKALESRQIENPSAEAIATEAGLPVEFVAKRLAIVADPISIGEVEETAEGVVDPSEPPEEICQRNMLKDEVARLLSTLEPRLERVLRLRFGIGVEEHTLEEVGQMYGVTRERIRQIEAKALRRLGHPSRSKHLRDAY